MFACLPQYREIEAHTMLTIFLELRCKIDCFMA